MSNNSVQAFSFQDQQVRTTTDDAGNVLFCGKDVAATLGYANTSKALQDHCKGVPFRYPLPTKGGNQLTRFITEPDLYRLIASSKLPTAQKFEAWIFEEVLPSIRKHGGYLTPEKVEEALLNPDTLIRLATDLKAERARRAELEAEAEANRPKVIFADAVNASKSTCLVGELAKILRGNGVQIGQNRLFEWMRQRGYLISRQGTDRNMPTQRSMELGLFEIKETAVTHSDGHVTLNRTPKVTGKGQTYFVNLFMKGAA